MGKPIEFKELIALEKKIREKMEEKDGSSKDYDEAYWDGLNFADNLKWKLLTEHGDYVH